MILDFFLDWSTGREDILLLAKLPMSSRLIGHENGVVEFATLKSVVSIKYVTLKVYLLITTFLF